nr:thermonuclease family protein [Nitrosospira multiformis]
MCTKVLPLPSCGSHKNLVGQQNHNTQSVEWSKQDRYQRVLGKVLLDGQDINLEQIKAGRAWHYKRYDKDQQLAERASMRRAKRQPVSRALDCGVM